MKAKYIIVGAGLAGLTTAYELMKLGEEDFLVLEGRDRIGGRILTQDGIDLGATWFQHHHVQLSGLLGELGVAKFRQYSIGRGVFIYSSMAPAQFFNHGEQETAAFRIAGGSMALIDALAEKLKDKIRLNHTVLSVMETEDGVTVQTKHGAAVAERIVFAIPLKTAAHLSFTPPLPEAITQAISNTHTWMSNAIKVGITYLRPFWREQNLSGTIIGHVGPTIELYDHSNQENSSFSLMGFVNEGLRDLPAEDRKERILAYIEKHLGNAARDYVDYIEKDWSTDPFTSNEKLKSVYISPSYGDPLFEDFYLNGKVFFSCAETSAVHGGYMDGAVISGQQAAKKLLDLP